MENFWSTSSVISYAFVGENMVVLFFFLLIVEKWLCLHFALEMVV